MVSVYNKSDKQYVNDVELIDLIYDNFLMDKVKIKRNNIVYNIDRVSKFGGNVVIEISEVIKDKNG